MSLRASPDGKWGAWTLILVDDELSAQALPPALAPDSWGASVLAVRADGALVAVFADRTGEQLKSQSQSPSLLASTGKFHSCRFR